MSDSQLTPMMAQYRRIKGELPRDAILLFRLGDFYEMFFEDAQIGAQILNVALTKRGTTPMCGIPFHAAPTYIARLLKGGKKVAICEQLHEAKPGQLVQREVTQIITPGTHFDERLLVAEKNNFLACVYFAEKRFGLARVDLTTGDFCVTEVEREEELRTELERLRPAEIIFPSESAALRALVTGTGALIQGHEDWVFAPETAQFSLRDHFKVTTLDGFGLRNKAAAIGAAGATLQYLSQHLRRDITHLTRLQFYENKEFLALDLVTLRNLDVLEKPGDAGSQANLFSALNRTVTPMGARRLREWLTQPLSKVPLITERHDAVEQLVQSGTTLDQLRESLKQVRDLERTIGRLSIGSGNARDLIALKTGLRQLPVVKEVLCRVGEQRLHDQLLREGDGRPSGSLLGTLQADVVELPKIIELIENAILDEPPLALKEGGLIRDGFDPALDELRGATRDGKDWIAKLQQDEIERTGIHSLKVRFNSVFGYYIEVTRSHLEKVPAHYVRKQTIANGERFITPELKQMESKIMGAEERSTQLEYELFQRVREGVLGEMRSIQTTAGALAQLDVLASFSETARLYNYCRPDVRDEGVIEITEGRHPVLDQATSEERFVPNDTILDPESQQIALITGPNMAGKSTYIRQVALLTLLSHSGSFLPAKKARIDLVDRIFTRIGASDDLSRGQSTFMVEMSETANILNNATRRSLIILDEIGRGTSTFDGLSLAWSIVEHLHNQVGAKTLFATHYHELTELAGRLSRIRNFNVAVREWNEQIVFLRKIVAGGTDKSYGIQVARLAGVPKAVLERAKEILRNLEESELTPEGKVKYSARHRAEREKLKKLAPAPQLDLFARG